MPPISFLHHLRNTFQAITCHGPREKLNKGLVEYNPPTTTTTPNPSPPPPKPSAPVAEVPKAASPAVAQKPPPHPPGSVVESVDDRTELSSCISADRSHSFVDPFDQALYEAEQMLQLGPNVPRLNIPMGTDGGPPRTWSMSSFGSDCSSVSSVSSIMGMGKAAEGLLGRRKSQLPQLLQNPEKRWKGHGRGISRNNHQSFTLDNVVMDSKTEDTGPPLDPDDIVRDDESIESCSSLGSARGPPSARGFRPNLVSTLKANPSSPDASSSKAGSPSNARAKGRGLLPSLVRGAAGRRVSVSVRR